MNASPKELAKALADKELATAWQVRLETPADEAQVAALNAEGFGPGRFAKSAYRLREGATHIVSTTSNTGVVRYGGQFAADTSKVLRNVRDSGAEHGPMTAFVGTAAVLLLFMLKS